jgi:uncharacterized membrane protein (UPF0127 family)
MKGLFWDKLLKYWVYMLLIVIVLIVLFLMIYQFIFAPNESNSNIDNKNCSDIWTNESDLNETEVRSSAVFNSMGFLRKDKPLSLSLLPLTDASMQLESFVKTESVSLDLEKQNLPIVCIKDVCFYIEIANTDDLRQKGLSSRKHLSSDSGMLFVFKEPGILNFWMKDMLFSLDLIWINEESQIVHIEKDLLPCSLSCPTYSSPKNQESFSKYVLEINGGLSEIHNFSIGDIVKVMI